MKNTLRRKQNRRDRLNSLAFLSPSLLGVGVFFVLPFCVVVYYSLIDGVATKNFVGVENFRKIISSVQLPFMFTDYRCDIHYGADDEARMDTLLKAAEAGADVIDVMADLYCASPLEITSDEKAIARQKETIEAVHRLGAKVVMSSHILDRSRTADECIAQLRAEEARGADIVKLVTMAYTQDDFLESIRCLMRLDREMPTPWIYLCGGPFARMQRFLGPHFGCAVEFAVHDYMTADYYDQPTIANFKKAAAAISWRMPDVI